MPGPLDLIRNLMSAPAKPEPAPVSIPAPQLPLAPLDIAAGVGDFGSAQERNPAPPSPAPPKVSAPPPQSVASPPSAPVPQVEPNPNPAQAAYEEYQQRIRELEQSAPKPPNDPSFDPIKVIGSTAAIIGAFGGLLSRQPLTAGLTALAEAGAAAKKNEYDRYSLNVQKWQTTLDYITQREKGEAERFKQLLAQYNTDRRIGLMELNLALKERGIEARSEAATLKAANQIARGEAQIERMERAAELNHQRSLFNIAHQIGDPETRQRVLAALSAVPTGSSLSAYSIAFENAGGQKVPAAVQTADFKAKTAQAISEALRNPDAEKNGINVGGFHVSGPEVKRYRAEMQSGKDPSLLSSTSKRIYDAIKAPPPVLSSAGGTSAPTGYLTDEQIKQLLISRGMTDKQPYESQYDTLPENVKKRLPRKWD